MGEIEREERGEKGEEGGERYSKILKEKTILRNIFMKDLFKLKFY